MEAANVSGTGGLMQVSVSFIVKGRKLRERVEGGQALGNDDPIVPILHPVGPPN